MSDFRFEFGKNWLSYIKKIDSNAIDVAKTSLSTTFMCENFVGKKFLDAGCGSGLFSLAAKELGATVVSFDFDAFSVQSTLQLKKLYYPDADNWTVLQGSLLNNEFMDSLGEFDYCYCWGVAHHTGNMWIAIKNLLDVAHKNKLLCLAIYNDQGFRSRYWLFIKLTYNRYRIFRPAIVFLHVIFFFGPLNLFKKFSGKSIPRAMVFWSDLFDWLGGYPFEVASKESIVRYCEIEGYSATCFADVKHRLGCNEFLISHRNGV